jgi:tRNA A-37 threonylcarbamoyl transferase component Bud32
VHDLPPTLREILAGRYVLKREIGRGGAATVYLAHDLRHERLVAIKLLHPELSHALGVQRFLREIKLTASLQHPHILPIHDSGEVDEQLFYVMPYIEGDSMRQRLGAANRLSMEEAVRIGREVAGALAYAHERGVVHRDIKPENILFSGGHAVLADFGIARAIDRAHEKITQAGTITGTPAYMSPEQARDRAFDGRSDVYSLACVLYEAIAGVPPFVGDTPQQLLTQRISKTPPLLREYRHDVPTPIESVIAKALSISPDDRFDDARAFSAALSAAVGNSGETLSLRAERRAIHRSPWAWAAGVMLLLTGAAAATPATRDHIGVLTGRVDAEQYAVVPFQYVGATAPAAEQEPVAQGLYAALREWNGVKVASDLAVLDAVRKSDDASLDGVLAVARRARAGKLVWGRVWATKDSLRVRAGIYDATDGSSLREVTLAGPRDLLQRQPGSLSKLAADLLRLEGSPTGAGSGDRGTRSFAAWRAYQVGRRAFGSWKVQEAIDAFERSAAADPDYAAPRVWLAQLLLWRATPATRWGPHASVAIRNRATLEGRDASVVDALQAMQRGDYLAACGVYARMRSSDSLDAAAWLGMAHCQGMDKGVVRSQRSPTGWAFRGSMAAAQKAYARALQITPATFGAFPFETVGQLFIVEMSRGRPGVGPDSTVYFGFPDIVGDTLASTALPLAQLGRAPFEKFAPNYDRALVRNRTTLLELLAALTHRLPDNPDVFESLAGVLELRDEITGTPNGGHSALSALERAKLLATDSTQRVRLGAADVRLHLKLGDFSRTYALADSVLAAMPRATGDPAAYLAGIAALLGREHAAVAYQRASGNSVSGAASPSIPALEDVSTALFMRAALGVCDDSLRALERQTRALLESYVSPAQRSMVSDQVLQRPLSLAIGCFGPKATLAISAPAMPVTHVEQALGRGDVRRARFLLDSIKGSRRVLRPGEFALDYMVAEVWLHAWMGDTAAAVKQLDLTLTALPTLGPYVLYEPGMAAAVGRSMVLRAELAASQRDAGTAALWAGRVLTLWAHADPSVAPTIARMRALANQRS